MNGQVKMQVQSGSAQSAKAPTGIGKEGGRRHPENLDLFFCSTCQDYKTRGSFNKCNSFLDKIGYVCKECRKKYREANIIHIREHRNKYQNDNYERIKENAKRYQIVNAGLLKEKRKKQYKVNAKFIIEKSRRYNIAHSKQVKKYMKKYRARQIVKMRRNAIDKNRRSVDPMFAISHYMGSLMWKGIKQNKGRRRWQELAGYLINDLMGHLEKQFTHGMTWKNYGKGKDKWHIDHKIPISAFNFTKPEHADFKKCWALSNLQPLWEKDNLSKGTKLDCHFQPSLAIGGRS